MVISPRAGMLGAISHEEDGNGHGESTCLEADGGKDLL